MGWKQMWDNTVAMVTPDWFLVRVTVYIVFVTVVPIITLFYIFTELFAVLLS